jgi:hypothetical protein
MYSKIIHERYLTYLLEKHIVILFAGTVIVICKAVLVHFMKIYGGVEA